MMPATPASTALLDQLRETAPADIDLSLDRMTALLRALGDPHLRLPPVIHIAGTNGKGSVAAFLRAIFQAAGLRVQSYTSPWVFSLHESIFLPGPGNTGAAINEARLGDALQAVLDATKGASATVFEAETAAALVLFARDHGENPADVTILETGLGGRLDATNVIAAPALTILTPVTQDHEVFLGHSIAEIAAEKAGILKQGVACVVARQSPEAFAVIKARADALNVPLCAMGYDWDAYRQQGRLVFQGSDHLIDLPQPGLAGPHQIENAGTAIAGARRFMGGELSEQAIAEGVQTARWPGRLERITSKQALTGLPAGSEIWLDGGHNAAAATALATAMADLEEHAPRPLYLIVAMLASKNPETFLKPFSGLVRGIAVLTLEETASTAGPGMDGDMLAGFAEACGITAFQVRDIPHALDEITIGAGGTTPVRVLICGSLHIARQLPTGWRSDAG